MLYDEKSGDWIRCPVCVEKYIPEVLSNSLTKRKIIITETGYSRALPTSQTASGLDKYYRKNPGIA